MSKDSVAFVGVTPMTFQAGAAIAANTLVKVTTTGKVINSISGDVPLGVVYDDAVLNEYVSVYPLAGKAQVQCGAAGAVAVGDLLRCDAAGQVKTETTATTPTAFTIGYALEVGTNAGDSLHMAKF